MRCIRVATSAIALVVASGPALAQSSALDAAVRTMGGKDRILAVRTLILEGTGEQLNFGQNHTPYAETKFEVTSFRRSFDYPNRRWFLDLTRVPKFVTANTAPQRQRQGLDGYPNAIAYNVGNNGNMVRASAQAATDRLNEFLYHPIGFVKAAYSSGTEISEEPGPNNTRRVRINPAGNKFAMDVDTRTNLPVRVEKIVDQPMLGDVAFYTEYADWQDVGGVKVPMRITQRFEDLVTIGDVRLTSTRIDADVGNIAVTDSIRNAAPVVQAGQQPPAPTIVVDTLAPGVWRIAGQSHHTIAIELSNQIVLVEAPQNDARTLAAIAKARELRPAKPLDLLINTHHHFDHAGGLRAAISQGLTIVTQQGNKEFYEKVVFPRRHTIVPDALAQNPKPLKLRTVGQTQVINDPLRTIEIHHVAGNPHNGNMLVVYLPAEKILIQADLYNPPAPNAQAPPSFPFAAHLFADIQRRGLQIDRVVGIHGNPVPFSELQAAAARVP